MRENDNVKKSIISKLLGEAKEYAYNPDDYFRDGKFVVKILGDELMNELNFKTMRDNNEVYFYDNGVYIKNGESFIRTEVRLRLGDKATNNRCNEVVSYIQDWTFCSRNAMETNLINTRNGLFNIGTGEVMEHNPEIFTTIQIPIMFNKDATCPEFDDFIKQILAEEDIPIIQELFGYCLYRDYPIQKAFMFIGDGANGKSTLLEVLKSLLGKENYSSVALQEFESNRFAKGRLYEKLANIYPDLSSKALKQTGIFKLLTGSDTIDAEKKFKGYFGFRNFAKIIFSTNKVPEAYDDTSAYYRRWVFINFPNVFEGDKADKNILKRLTTEKELSGIFNWAIEGLKRLMEQNDFSYSLTTEEVRDQYERLSSPIKAFVKDCVISDVDEWVVKETLYSAYAEYCREHNLPSIVDVAFSKKLKQEVNVTTEQRVIDGKRGIRVWRGINLKSKTSQVTQVTQGFLSTKVLTDISN